MFSNKEFTFKIYTQDDTEAIFLSQKDTEAGPLIILIHGFNRFGAWELLWQAQRLVKAGYCVLLPSQPGFGGSLGTRDYCGPDTIQRIGNLIEHFLEKSDYNFPTVILWGASRGALVGCSLLAKYPSLFGAGILQAGIYDLKKDYEWVDKSIDIKKNIQDETGATEKNFLQRAPIKDVSKIQCPLLIMHGLKDTTVSYTQSEDLSKQLEKFNKEHRLHILEDKGHHLSSPLLTKEYVFPFLEPILKRS